MRNRTTLLVGAPLLLACGRPPESPRAAVAPEPSQPVVESVSTQEILTPLPLRVWLPSRYGAERVLVFYQTWGSDGWEALELARAGQTWSGEVSCRAVSTVTGDTRYYFLAVDGQSRAVIGSGWPEWPHVATVVSKLPEGPQGLVGMSRPNRCHDPADCPPDFQGCPAYSVRRPVCHEETDCREGSSCDWDGYCSKTTEEPELPTNDARLAAAVRAALHKKHDVASAQYSSAR